MPRPAMFAGHRRDFADTSADCHLKPVSRWAPGGATGRIVGSGPRTPWACRTNALPLPPQMPLSVSWVQRTASSAILAVEDFTPWAGSQTSYSASGSLRPFSDLALPCQRRGQKDLIQNKVANEVTRARATDDISVFNFMETSHFKEWHNVYGKYIMVTHDYTLWSTILNIIILKHDYF